ncbi:MAG: FKBP-type peptidyl-prolyl cis-trans isomerase [Bacteroidota bacterium]
MRLSTGLRYEVLEEGAGRAAQIGDNVIIKEKLEYPDGTLLYTTEGRGVNLPRFTLGRKHVIDGVDQGVQGMRVGEIRKLIVPPELSKREEYPKFLSPDSTLVYTIELVTIM